VASNRLSSAEIQAVRERVHELVKACVDGVALLGATRLIVAGGTVRALARLARTWRKKANRSDLKGMVLTRSELYEIFERLESASDEMKLAMPTVQPRRADLMPIGALILSELLEVLDREALVVSDWGIREGIILEALAPGLDTSGPRS